MDFLNSCLNIDCSAAESKQSMLRTASSIQSRSIVLTASSTGSTRPAQGAIAAFYLPSKKQTPRRKQGESQSPVCCCCSLETYLWMRV